MGRLDRPFLRRLRDEAGVTLLELLVAASLMLVVVSGALAVMLRTMRSENTSQQFSEEIQIAQSGLARMMRDVRQSTRIVQASATTIRFVVPGATDHVVQYECDVPQTGTTFTQCMRTKAVLGANVDPNSVSMPAATTGAPTVLRVTNGAITSGADPNAVFHYQAPGQAGIDSTGQPVDANGAPIPPTYVEARVSVPSAGKNAGTPLAEMSHTTVLSSGAYLRNADIGS
jgi:Tfp pilus assembly protein PilV